MMAATRKLCAVQGARTSESRKKFLHASGLNQTMASPPALCPPGVRLCAGEAQTAVFHRRSNHPRPEDGSS